MEMPVVLYNRHFLLLRKQMQNDDNKELGILKPNSNASIQKRKKKAARHTPLPLIKKNKNITKQTEIHFL